MKKILLVTGVAGFLGHYIAQYFNEQGWAVIGVDQYKPEGDLRGVLLDYHAMLLPSTEFGGLISHYSPDFCIHCAGGVSVGKSMSDPISDFYAGPCITAEILNALRLYAPDCGFLFLSSAAVYGTPLSLPVTEQQMPSPLSPYGYHKWQSEILCREFHQVYGLPASSVRIFSAYGPGLRRQVIWDTCQKITHQKQLLMMGSGRESRDFIHGLDIAHAVFQIANTAPMQGESYNLGSGQEVTISDLVNMVLPIIKSDLEPQFDGIVPPGTPLNWRADISTLTALGFTPSISLEQGLEDYVEWYLSDLKHAG